MRSDELGGQARLPDPGRAEERDELRPLLGDDVLPDPDEHAELRRATEHRHLPPPPLAGRECRGESSPDADRQLLALRNDLAGLLVVDGRPRRSKCLFADEDPVHRRGFLQTRSGVDDVTGHHPLPVRRARGQRHERLARVDGDPHLQVEVRIGLVELMDGLADRDRRAHRPLGIVAVGNRRSEHGHDRISDELLDRAAERLDLVPHSSEVRREDRAHVLGIEPLRAGGEPDEVGEEHGDDLPLLGQSALGRQCSAAFRAELRERRVLLAAIGTRNHRQSVWDPDGA